MSESVFWAFTEMFNKFGDTVLAESISGVVQSKMNGDFKRTANASIHRTSKKNKAALTEGHANEAEVLSGAFHSLSPQMKESLFTLGMRLFEKEAKLNMLDKSSTMLVGHGIMRRHVQRGSSSSWTCTSSRCMPSTCMKLQPRPLAKLTRT